MRVSVAVKPGSRHPSVTRLAAPSAAGPPTAGRRAEAEDPQILVRVAARAQEGAANDAVRRALAAALRVRPSDVTLHRGHRSRIKQFDIDAEPAGLKSAIAALPIEASG